MNTAVILLGFGAPSSINELEPFMRSVMGGRSVPPERLAEARARYQAIGGRSPYLDITSAQAAALQDRLADTPGRLTVDVGLRHGTPTIAQAMDHAMTSKPDVLVAMNLSPFFSKTTTEGYYKAFEEALPRGGAELEVVRVPSWHNEPGFIDALVASIDGAFADMPAEDREATEVVFTAHSVPRTAVEGGDPYPYQVMETVELAAAQAGLALWRLAWQSGRPEGWLEPDIDVTLKQLSGSGCASVLVVPAGFVSDHVETLYDLDIAARREAEAHGIMYHRAPGLNTSPRFIDALAHIVIEHLPGGGA